MTDLVSQEITNLQNGVSQQAPALRFTSQCQEQENCLNDPVVGMGKRPNSVLLGTTTASNNPAAARYSYTRDDVESYRFVLEEGVVQAYDARTGYEYSVNIHPDVVTYMSIADGTPPNKAYKLLTSYDTTLLLNKTKEVKALPAAPAQRTPEGLWYVKQADYNTSYNLNLSGVTVTHTTPEATSSRVREGLKSTAIAQDIANKVNAAGGYTAQLYGSVVHIVKTDGSDFAISASDDLGDRASVAIKGAISDVSLLPNTAPEGFHVEVRGKAGDIDTEPYYVEFRKTSGQGTKTSGVWEETLADGVVTSLDNNTLPVEIKRLYSAGHVNADNPRGIYFDIQLTTWADRTVGDEKTAPLPSFVDRRISEMVFHKNRLGFISEENITFSEAGEFYNYFPTTTITMLDADPIDTAIALDKVAPVEHAITHAGELFLFAPEIQLKVVSGDIFNNKTIDVLPLSHYETDVGCAPFISEGTIHFWMRGDKYAALYEYVPQGDSDRYIALPLSAHVPRYVDGYVQKSVPSQQEGFIFHLTQDSNGAAVNHLYVTNVFTQGHERVQNAWQKWSFHGKVLDVDAQNDVLNLTILRTDGVVQFERITLSHDKLAQEIGYPVLLDAREEVDENFMLPLEDTRVIFSHDGRYWVGYRYNQKYVFTQFFKRGSENEAVTEGRLQLRYMTLAFHSTTNFVTTVDRGSVDQRIKTYEGRLVDGFQNLLGVIPITSGTFRLPIHTKSDRAVITITNDTEQDAVFHSASWEGTYTRRNRRM